MIVVLVLLLIIVLIVIIRTIKREKNQHIFFSTQNQLTKGENGELTVETLLSSLPEDRFLCFHDIMLQNGNVTTQIDHIVFTRSAILVIETKNYAGELHGGEDSEYWTQIFNYLKWGRYHRSERYEIYNPLLQNKKHCEVIQKYIWDLMDNVSVVPILCVSNSCNLNLRITESIVLKVYQLLDFVSQYDTDIVGQEKQEQLARRIISNNIKDPVIREQHKENVRRIVEEKHTKESLNICPRCGGNLVIRNGKYGPFWGCSNYPNCKYTRKM